MRKAVKITKVVIFYTICISFIPYVFVVTNYHKLDGLKPQTFIVSQLLRLEVSIQGIGRNVLLKPLGKNLPPPPFYSFLN